MKIHNSREINKLYDTCTQHIRASKASGKFDMDMFLTIIMELKVDEVTKLVWMEYSNDLQTMPLHAN